MQKCDKTVAKSSKFRLVAINVSYIVSCEYIVLFSHVGYCTKHLPVLT